MILYSYIPYLYFVYNEFTLEVEFTGTNDECVEFIANYGGGWSALKIAKATKKDI